MSNKFPRKNSKFINILKQLSHAKWEGKRIYFTRKVKILIEQFFKDNLKCWTIDRHQAIDYGQGM